MRAEAQQSVTAGVAPGGAQSSRCLRRSRQHPFGLGGEGLRRREGLLPGCPLAAAPQPALHPVRSPWDRE